MRTIPLLCSVAAMVIAAGCAAPSTHHPAGTAGEPNEVRQVIATDRAPAAIGPYSQAVRVGRNLYLSGQIGIDPATGEMVPGGVEAETRQALANAGAVLEAAGFTHADVVQSIVFLADMDDYAAVNAVYGELFSGAPPARAAVEVAGLPKDARVEIMMTAIKLGT